MIKHMKKIIILFGIAAAVCWSCNRSILSENLFLRGRVFLTDTITQNSYSIPLPNASIKVSGLGPDTVDYLLQTNTDSAGYFTFNLLNDGPSKFRVFFNGIVGANYYFAADTVNKGDQDIVLTVRLSQTYQNGYSIGVIDTAGQPVPNVSIGVYSNAALAAINDPSGAIQNLQTDINGRFFKLNVPAGVYYMNAVKISDTSTYQRLMKQVVVHSTSIVMDTIILSKLIFSNELSDTVVDSLNGRIPAATVYVYTSQVLAATNDPGGAVVASTTDMHGIFTAINLPPGVYYVNATKTAGNVIYQRLAKKFLVMPSGITADTMAIFTKQ
jgi:hypothetical protein